MPVGPPSPGGLGPRPEAPTDLSAAEPDLQSGGQRGAQPGGLAPKGGAYGCGKSHDLLDDFGVPPWLKPQNDS